MNNSRVPQESMITPAYLWFDTEFTGLDTDHAALLQVALLVTDSSLRRLTAPDRDVNLCIRLDASAPVSPWVEKNLAGLLARCRSNEAVPLEEADRRLAALIDEAVGPPSDNIKRRPVLAGNTVHMDLTLARKFLPELTRRLHYRLLDVSTLKVLWNDWFSQPAFDKGAPDLVRQHVPAGLGLPVAGEHDAYYDIHASLAELNYYRQKLSIAPAPAA
jgi:oligoribonuclease